MSGYAQDGFERSRVLFEQVVAELAGEDADERTHAQLEEQVAERGRELMRQLYQDHVDLRAAREQRQRVVDAGQVVHTRVERDHQRRLATVFGQVTVPRMAYRAPGEPNLYPADSVLNLPDQLYSYGLRKLVAAEPEPGSFEATATALERATGVRVGKRQVEALAQAAAVDIEAFYTARRPAAAGPDRLLVMSFDGKGIVMIPSALRQATAKAAKRSRHKLATRLSPGEKQGRKRMAELAAVYDAVPVERTPADVIGGRPPGGQRRRGPKTAGKWLTASVVDDIATVIAAGFDEAVREFTATDHSQPASVTLALTEGFPTRRAGGRGIERRRSAHRRPPAATFRAESRTSSTRSSSRTPPARTCRCPSIATQFASVPALIPNSRATWAIDLPVSATIRTAPSLKFGSNFLLVSDIALYLSLKAMSLRYEGKPTASLPRRRESELARQYAISKSSVKRLLRPQGVRRRTAGLLSTGRPADITRIETVMSASDPSWHPCQSGRAPYPGEDGSIRSLQDV